MNTLYRGGVLPFLPFWTIILTMNETGSLGIIKTIFLGKRYSRITSINDKARWMTMNLIFTIVMVPLFLFGISAMEDDPVRAAINFSIAGICILTLILLRTNISLQILPLIPVTLFGLYCVFLLSKGELFLWLAVWFFAYPLIAIFLCQLLKGIIASTIGIAAAAALLYYPSLSPAVYNTDPLIKSRFIAGYMLIFILTIIFGYVNVLKDKKEETLNAELESERDGLKKVVDKATSEISIHLQKATEDGKKLNKAIIESSQSLGLITENMEATLEETNIQLVSVEQTSDHVSQIVRSIDNLEEAVILQASHISSSSASIEEMVANIASIRSIAAGISKTVEILSNSSASGNTMLQKLSEEVNHLHERSAMLQEANKIIEDIAAKTNLLAMNAAIEAAHAGETGKGFAVVAAEVRKLAESASNESKSISEEINKMERSIKSIGGVTGETVRSMNLIFNEITSMDSAFAQVNSAVEEQAAGGAAILTALKSIKEETERVRGGSEDIQIQSGSISNEMQKLQQISGNVTKRVNEVSEASKQIASFLDNAKKVVSA